MSGPPRINDTVHNQLDMEWSNSLGEKKKPWKTMLSFVIILAVICWPFWCRGSFWEANPAPPMGKEGPLCPARLGNPTHIPARRRPALPMGTSHPKPPGAQP